MRHLVTSVLCWSVLAVGAQADTGWACTNDDLEITCDGAGCAAAEGAFTPTALTVDTGHISYCAYSGCWEGAPQITLTDKSFYALGLDLPWSGSDSDDTETVQIAIDPDEGRGVLIGGGFAMPLACVPWSCGEGCN